MVTKRVGGMHKTFADISGYLIAGGQSRRFGSDKRLVEFEGEPLLERAGRVMCAALGELPVMVGNDVIPLSDQAWRVISDARSEAGPIGGIVAALEDSRTDWIMALAVDLPLMRCEDLQCLAAARRESFDVLTLSIDGRPEPLAALYHCRKTSFWRDRLDRNELSLSQALPLISWQPVMLEKQSRSLTNINFLSDFECL